MLWFLETNYGGVNNVDNGICELSLNWPNTHKFTFSPQLPWVHSPIAA